MKNTEAIYFYFHLYNVYPVHEVTAVMLKNLAFLFPWSPFFGLSFEHLFIFKLAYNLLVRQTYFWFDEQKLLCYTWGNADAIK